MANRLLLTIVNDRQVLQLLRKRLLDRQAGASGMLLARTIDEACSLLLTIACPRLIVVHWSRGSRYEEMNRLLWTTTVLAQRIPVLVIADRYRIDQATRLYRMGATDYISRTHHQHQLGRILNAYLHNSPTPKPGTGALADQPRRLTHRSSRQHHRARNLRLKNAPRLEFQ
jgi:hypothetical protein